MNGRMAARRSVNHPAQQAIARLAMDHDTGSTAYLDDRLWLPLRLYQCWASCSPVSNLAAGHSNAILAPIQRRPSRTRSYRLSNRSHRFPREELLNRQYRLTLEDSQSTYVDSSASQWSSGSVDHVGYIKFSTQCLGDQCIATSIPTSDPDAGQTVETLVWSAGEWSSREKPITDGDGLDESTTTLHFDGP